MLSRAAIRAAGIRASACTALLCHSHLTLWCRLPQPHSSPASCRRYDTYDELYDYCYRVAGTVALMSVPVMGVDKSYKVCACCLDPAMWQALLAPTLSANCWRIISPPRLLQGTLEQVYRSALALGTANQLTNILRDVGEDASQRNRIYVPLEELEAFKIREEEVRLCSSLQPTPHPLWKHIMSACTPGYRC